MRVSYWQLVELKLANLFPVCLERHESELKRYRSRLQPRGVVDEIYR